MSENLKQHLKQLKRLKARKPRFARQESWRYSRLGDRWRRPQGVTSRMRRRRIGLPRRVKVGYKSPESLRHLHSSGLSRVIVHNVKDVEELDPRKHAVMIAHTVGERKRIGILDRARTLDLKVLNPRVPRATGAPELDHIEESQSTQRTSPDDVNRNEEEVQEK